MTEAPSFTWGKRRVWGVLAKPSGSRSGGKLCTTLFPASRSPEEALDRVVRAAVQSPGFRQRWQGWQFLAVELGEMVEVGADAVVRRHVNEQVKMEGKGR